MAGERFASLTATPVRRHTSRDGCRRKSCCSSAMLNHQSFLYLLEAWVSMMAPIVFAPCLDTFYVQCCDNEAARHALIKGVGKHQPLNFLLAAHWTWHNRKGLAHRIERLPTKSNVADPISLPTNRMLCSFSCLGFDCKKGDCANTASQSTYRAHPSSSLSSWGPTLMQCSGPHSSSTHS